MDRVKLKVYTDEAGDQWVAAGLATTTSESTAKPTMIARLIRDDRDTQLHPLTGSDWNALPCHWFASEGPAPKTDVEHRRLLPGC